MSSSLITIDTEARGDDQPLLLPPSGSLPVWRRRHQCRIVGAALLGVLVFVGLAGIAHRPLHTTAPRSIIAESEHRVPVDQSGKAHTLIVVGDDDNSTADTTAAPEDSPLAVNGPPLMDAAGKLERLTDMPLAGAVNELKDADGEVQELVDGLKVHVPSMLKQQGWDIGLGSFKALSYCQQVVAGLNYFVKVQVADDNVPKVARAGEVLQMTIYKQLGKAPAVLTSVQMVARDDAQCIATPLASPPALPHVVLDATPSVQALCDAVRADVPKMLKISGWTLDLAPYKALSYCGDGVSYIVKVKVAKSQAALTEYSGDIFLQLLLRAPQGSADEASLMGALMVTPVDKTCASLPVLPSMDHLAAQLPLGEVPAEQVEQTFDNETVESELQAENTTEPEQLEKAIPEPKPQEEEISKPRLQAKKTAEPELRENAKRKPQDTEDAKTKRPEKVRVEPKPEKGNKKPDETLSDSENGTVAAEAAKSSVDALE